MSPDDADISLDEELREAVLKALKDDESTANLDLRVGVLNAIVHLGGNAASEDLWYRAEQIVESIPGVRGVVNRIEAPGAPNPARPVNLNLHNLEENTGETL